MRFAIDTTNFGDYSNTRLLAELAQEAEAFGWDGFFLWDHIGANWAFPTGGWSAPVGINHSPRFERRFAWDHHVKC